jgi:diguanylate cyclase (GGDEF)-like protein
VEETAEMLRRCFRQSDALGRLGGDEFAAILAQDAGASLDWLRPRIVREQETLNRKLNRPYRIAVNVGFAKCEAKPFLALEDIVAADRNMYEHKQTGAELLVPSPFA